MTDSHSLPPVMSREEVRRIDARAVEEYGMSSLVLMENAGRGCAEWLARIGIRGEVVICAGKGNNGGDGFVIARHLENARVSVQVLMTCAVVDLKGDALSNVKILQSAGTSLHEWNGPEEFEDRLSRLTTDDWIVDALLGTGMTGEVREPYRSVISSINSSHARVLAVDLPSGMDCDTGEILGCCVEASCTATFVALKPCMTIPTARRWTGPVRVIDIGVPRGMWDGSHDAR